MVRRLARSEDGFTLMEILFVVALMTILILIAFASYYASTGRARATACRATQRVLQDGVTAYQVDNEGALPPSLDDVEPYVQRPDTPLDDGITYDSGTGEVSCTEHP